jgi:uncharacterized HAD superfamily protein
MNIGVDIDGVIADADPVFRQYIHELFGKYLPREKIISYYYEKVFDLTDKQIENLWAIVTERDAWSRFPLVPEARETIEIISKSCGIFLITARPLDTKESTRAWLNQNGIKYSSLIFSKEYKGKHDSLRANNLCLDYHIEDKLENAIEMAENSVKVLLFDYPWNQADVLPRGIKRISGWSDVPVAIGLETR